MKIQFTRDFYNPKTREYIKKDSIIEIEDNEGVPLDKFWRGIISDNEIGGNIINIKESKKK